MDANKSLHWISTLLRSVETSELKRYVRRRKLKCHVEIIQQQEALI